MCTPSERWMPEQVKHTNTPRLTLDHVGFLVPQSAHILLPSCLSTAARMRLCSCCCSSETSFLLVRKDIGPDHIYKTSYELDVAGSGQTRTNDCNVACSCTCCCFLAETDSSLTQLCTIDVDWHLEDD